MRLASRIAGAVRRAGALGEAVAEDTAVAVDAGPGEVAHPDVADPGDGRLEVDD